MKKLGLGVLFSALIIGGCSSGEGGAKSSSNAQETPEEVEAANQAEDQYVPKDVKYYKIEDPGRELTDLEKELLRYPGKYSGDQYDEVKVNAELDQLPDHLTEEQYMEELIYLLSEDYHEEMETLLHFDPNVEVQVDRPDESVELPAIKSSHYAILIDASGSMKAMSGNKPRMSAAKEAVMEFAEQIPENATISMRVYGHKGTGSDADKDLSCSSTESFYNGAFDKDPFQEALEQVKPAGWTPIGLALETVKEDIPENTDHAVVYVVSDGIETCGGDPVASAEDLVSDEVETVVNIIGFDIDNEAQKLLKDVATAGNGEYTYVSSEQDLKKYMRAQYEEIQRAWREWKEEGKKQAREIKEEKKKTARETKESMKVKSRREKERMKKAQTYLKEKYDDIHHPVNPLFSRVVDYGNAKWRYAVDAGNKAWRDSVDSGNEQWREYVDEGNKRIRETIDKKNQQ
ncbi:VWA domain-containing protein [Siminovitchia sediminis]|uniref:VWA domain-containing protein n=1 Tax=Siminovitchia sediminis TaxID=1274353 RepID=A0ABW4KL84_9BACI